MSAEARAQLGALQGELVEALVGDGPAPAGFDAGRLRAAAASLAVKRRRAAARAWRGLAAALGGPFAERFDAFAATTPLPRDGGPLADGRVFLRWLGKTELPEEVRLQAL